MCGKINLFESTYVSLTELLTAYLNDVKLEYEGIYGIRAFKNYTIVLKTIDSDFEKTSGVLNLYREVIESLNKEEALSLIEEICKINNIYLYLVSVDELIYTITENIELDIIVFRLNE